jgi:hypothetical protein
MIKNTLRKLFKQKFGTKQDVLLSVPGQLGNGKGTVVVPGRPNYVYVRVAGFVEEVYNSRVQADNDMPVIVGYDPAQPKLYQVLTTRMSSTGTASGGYAPAIRYTLTSGNCCRDGLGRVGGCSCESCGILCGQEPPGYLWRHKQLT